MKTFIVTDYAKKLPQEISGVQVIDTHSFFTEPIFQSRHLRIINLCKSYQYQSSGYYVSLLASARGQRIVPHIESILDVKSRFFIRLKSENLDELIQKSFKDIQSSEFDLSLYFGKNTAKKYDKLAYELYKAFNVPLARARFRKKDKWRLQSISPIGLSDVPESHLSLLSDFASEYFKKRQLDRKDKAFRFDLAILVNPEEKMPPSNAKALDLFLKAAHQLEVSVTFITRSDMHRLAEFDGLFIRETTEVNHHTFRFSQKAHSLGLAVIDDPLSILRCTNKVYLAELFEKNKINTPKTQLLYKESYTQHIDNLVYPLVVKTPDSSFSRGVVKVTQADELKKVLLSMFEESDVVLIQEFIPTEFDWRIGIINGEPFYACKYFMARSHWQIYHHQDGECEDGEAETLELYVVPKEVLDLACQATKLIGSGLYGVDIKEKDGKLFVIEINDNPSIDAGCEDLVGGKAIYEKIILHMRDQMEKIALGKPI